MKEPPDPLNDISLRVRLLQPWLDEMALEQHDSGEELALRAPDARGLVHHGIAEMLDTDPADRARGKP